MAVISHATVLVAPGAYLVTWTGLNETDTAQPYICPNFPDKSIHFFGDFGTSGTILLQGTNDSTPDNYLTLTDPQGNAISKTAAAIEQVLENVHTIRPHVSVGTSVVLSAHLLISTIGRR